MHFPSTAVRPPSNLAAFAAKVRATIRLARFGAILLGAMIEWSLIVTFARKTVGPRNRAAWLQRLCRRLARFLAITVDYDGAPPRSGLLVCNHLSYLDIILLAARHPISFVAKKDVRNWPVIGWLAACGGTLFIDREQRSDVSRVGAQLGAVLATGTVVCIFAEGTSSDGREVLPFRPSLLQPAIDAQSAVTPAWLGYSLPDGSAAEEVCYWRDMSFGPHFLHLLTRRGIRAHVCFGTSRAPSMDRKRLAVQLRSEVRRLGGLEPRFPLPQAA